MKDLEMMPPIRDGNVFAYLTHQCHWSRERLDTFQKDDGLVYIYSVFNIDVVGNIVNIVKDLYFTSC